MSFRSALPIRKIMHCCTISACVLQSVQDTLQEDGLEEMARVYELMKLGETWPEISAKLGQGEEALKRRFYRFRKKFRSNT